MIKGMGKLYSETNWLIKVQGNEHPPVHVHVLNPDGRASIRIDGEVLNHGVPARIVAKVLAWVAENTPRH